MNTMVGCPIPGASQPKDPVRLVDANGILRSVGMSGCGYEGSEYQAYKLVSNMCAVWWMMHQLLTRNHCGLRHTNGER